MTPEELRAKYNIDATNIVPTSQTSTPQGLLASRWNTDTTPKSTSDAGPLGGVADFIGGKKLAEGLGHTIANAGGAQDATIAAQDQGQAIQGNIIKQIKLDRVAGKDTSKLQAALQALGGDLANEGKETTDLGTGGLTNREVIGSAVQLGANALPGAGKGASLWEKAALGGGAGYVMDIGNKMQGDKSGAPGDVLPSAGDLIPGAGAAIGAALPFAAEFAGFLAKNVAGFTSGTGAEALERAAKDPDTVGAAVKKYATTPESKQSLVDRAKAAIMSFTQGKQDEYGEAIDKLAGNAETANTGPAVVDSFMENVKKFGGDVSDKGELSFTNSTLTKSDQNAVSAAWDTVKNWTDDTPKGFDNLRQAIGNHMDEFRMAGNDRANVILGGVKDALTSDLTQNIPGYGDILEKYGNKSEVTKQIIKELQLGGGAKASTQLNNVMRIFKKDPTLQQHLVDVMGQKGADDFLNEISGAVLSSWVPEGKLMPLLKGAGEVGIAGGAALAGGAGAAVIPAVAGAASMSPRIVGAGARAVGKLGEKGVGRAAQKAATMIASETQQ